MFRRETDRSDRFDRQARRDHRVKKSIEVLRAEVRTCIRQRAGARGAQRAVRPLDVIRGLAASLRINGIEPPAHQHFVPFYERDMTCRHDLEIAPEFLVVESKREDRLPQRRPVRRAQRRIAFDSRRARLGPVQAVLSSVTWIVSTKELPAAS